MWTPAVEVFLSDVHFPYQDRSAWALALAVIKRVKPDLVWIGGDFVDFYAVSRYDKTPHRKLGLQDEIDSAVEGFWQLRRAAGKRAEIVWQVGNHEERLQKYLWGKAPELSVLRSLSVEGLFSLDKVAIRFVGDYRAQAVGKLWHLHGDKAPGGNVNPARGKMAAIHDNIIFGHHHKIQVEYQRDLNGVVRGAFANGCLCGLEPEFAPYNDWSQGVSVVRYTKGGAFHVDQVPFFSEQGKLRCLVDGRLIEV